MNIYQDAQNAVVKQYHMLKEGCYTCKHFLGQIKSIIGEFDE